MSHSCRGCGVCCKLFLINLSEKEYYSGQYQTIFQEYGLLENFTKAKNCGANILAQHPDGSCIYLQNKQCTIHAIRPQVCRQFFCTSKAKKFAAMIKTIKLTPLSAAPVYRRVKRGAGGEFKDISPSNFSHTF